MHTASYEFLMKPKESAGCHQTLSARVGSGLGTRLRWRRIRHHSRDWWKGVKVDTCTVQYLSVADRLEVSGSLAGQTLTRVRVWPVRLSVRRATSVYCKRFLLLPMFTELMRSAVDLLGGGGGYIRRVISAMLHSCHCYSYCTVDMVGLFSFIRR